MSESIDLTIFFTGDWCIGQGAGRQGEADSLVKRDHNNLPYAPAKTIVGIWRDACEMVARGLDDNKDGAWCELVEAVFGSQPVVDASNKTHHKEPVPALVSVTPAHLPDALRQLLTPQENKPLLEAMTFLKPGNAIDHDTGFAKDDMLRFEEVVRGGCSLNVTATLEMNNGSLASAKALLWAGASVVERLGGKRRRGMGRCSYNMKQEESYLEALNVDPIVPELNPRNTKAIYPFETPSAGIEWVELDIELEVVTPVIIPKQTIGNVVYTMDGIPGTHLLGPVTKALGSSGVDLFPHVASGYFQVSFAWPKVGNKRGLPVPYSLFYEKESGGLEKGQTVRNRLYESAGSTQLKNHRGGFVGPVENSTLPKFETVSFSSNTHNTVSDKEQRPNKEVGGVYTYQAIPIGTILRSKIKLAKSVADKLGNNWEGKIGGTWCLGVAKKDDYGKVLVKVVGEPKAIQVKQNDCTQFTLWLLSDLLIRDEHLR